MQAEALRSWRGDGNNPLGVALPQVGVGIPGDVTDTDVPFPQVPGYG